MKKTILNDDSTCCSVCFDMLKHGDEIYIDEENDVICKDCITEVETEQ